MNMGPWSSGNLPETSGKTRISQTCEGAGSIPAGPTRAESIRVMHPLFQAGQGGSIPTSAISLVVDVIDFDAAAKLNALWHSVLPEMDKGSGNRGMAVCYCAYFDNLIYAVAIWSSPVNQTVDDGKTIELRRLAIAPDAPKNTASRMLAVMARLLKARFPTCERLISYQATAVHAGTIYRAAGWIPTTRPSFHRRVHESAAPPRSAKKRAVAVDGYVKTPRTRRPPQIESDKQRWEKMI